MKTFVITAAAALALGLGAGAASAAQPSGKPMFRGQVPDGLVQHEDDRGRRWMRTWRDAEEYGDSRRADGDRQGRRYEGSHRGKPAGRSEERSWQGSEDNRGGRPPKPRD